MPDRDPYKFPAQSDLDRVTDALSKIIGQVGVELFDHPEDFYLTHARTGRSWNLGTARPSSWLTDTLNDPEGLLSDP